MFEESLPSTTAPGRYPHSSLDIYNTLNAIDILL